MKNITAKEYQDKILELGKAHNINPKSEVLVYLAGLIEEVGELIELVSDNIEFDLSDISQLHLLDDLEDFIKLSKHFSKLKRIFRQDKPDGKLHEILSPISFTLETKLKITKESGDVQAYKTLLDNAFDINLEEVLKINLAKIEARKLNGTLKGNGDDR